MSAKVLAFPKRPAPETGVLLGVARGRVPCPTCSTPLQPFRAYWLPNKDNDPYWLCTSCNEVCGPPLPDTERGLTAALSLTTGGPVGAPVVRLSTSTGRAVGEDVFRFEAWVSDDGLVRITRGNMADRNLDDAQVLTPKAVAKLSRDFADLARTAKEQQERLRGDDRWRVRPCPDRPGIFFVKRMIWENQYREVPFCRIKIQKARHCSACMGNSPPGSTMYREETSDAWANPSWRDVRICSACVARVDRGSPESTAAAPPHSEGTTS